MLLTESAVRSGLSIIDAKQNVCLVIMYTRTTRGTTLYRGMFVAAAPRLNLLETHGTQFSMPLLQQHHSIILAASLSHGSALQWGLRCF